MFVLAALSSNISFVVEHNSRLVILIITGIMFIIDIGLFGYITNKLGVVEEVFGEKFTKSSINKLVNRFVKKS